MASPAMWSLSGLLSSAFSRKPSIDDMQMNPLGPVPVKVHIQKWVGPGFGPRLVVVDP